MPRGSAERELSRGIDHRMEHMNAVYGPLPEEGRILRSVNDAKARDELIEWIDNILRCMKISEFSSDALLRKRVYRVELLVSANGIARGRLLQ